jgi:glyoxylase-like metal-dependent hydrolase (beta-lactamase superfamily II)
MPEVSVLKPGSLIRDESGNILDARSSVALVTSGPRKIIVDTGQQDEEFLIIDALARRGLEPHDIDIVINTHPHLDHCGNNHLFPCALRLIPADGEILVPGVWAMATPGHTLDSISVVVEATKSANVKASEVAGAIANEKASILVIAGDALPTLNNFLKGVPPALNVDRDLAATSMSRIIEIADIVVPGHDRPFSVAEGKYIQLEI